MSDTEKLKRGVFYPLGDRMDGTKVLVPSGIPGVRMMATWTGEKRKPKCGDWFLSGAVITAYRARGNLDTEYHIARLVKTRKVTTIQEVQ